MKISITVLLGISLVLIAESAFSAEDNELSNGLSDCLSEVLDDERLACFDQLAKNHLKLSAPQLDKEIALSPVQAKLKEKQLIADFSKEDLIKTDEEKGLDSITSTITKIKKLLRGRLIIDLENGQQWEQKDSAQIKLKEGDLILLKKGALGVVYLSNENSYRSIRVKRLK